MIKRLISAVAIASFSIGSAPVIAAPSAASSLPRLSTCNMSSAVKPQDVTLACGDGNSGLSKMHWSSWTPSAAVGSGQFWWNDCNPNCAAGHGKTHAVTVRLSHPKTIDRKVYFTQLFFVGGSPDGGESVVNVSP